MYAMWHAPHHPPFLEVFETICPACTGGVCGTVGAGVTDGALGEPVPVSSAGALVSAPSGVLTWFSDMVKCK